MKTKLVRIGNSRGVRLPKPMIEEARLADEVDVHVRDINKRCTSGMGRSRKTFAR
jgi:antitoxin component of MazEF toxin-antitoxin module